MQIISFEGDYNNEDAYNRVLGYIAQKKYIGGFGFSCTPELSIVKWFQLSEFYSNYSNTKKRKIWHFTITFQKEWDNHSLISMAVWVSGIFREKYQSLWGVDYSPGTTPHLHFGINAFSYHPDIPPLSETEMHGLLENLLRHLQQLYPSKTVSLIFKERSGSYVRTE